MYDFMPRSICVAEVVNGKLFSARSLNIRFMEADATTEGMTAKVMEALGSNEPVTVPCWTAKEMKSWTQSSQEVSCMIRLCCVLRNCGFDAVFKYRS